MFSDKNFVKKKLIDNKFDDTSNTMRFIKVFIFKA